mgnify:CR=1 FL=1
MSNKEETQEVDKILDIDDETLKIRVQFIQEALQKTVDILRKNIPEDLSDDDAAQNENFRNWTLTNLIISILRNDKLNLAASRLAYFLFEKSDKNIIKFISHFSLTLDYEVKNSIRTPKWGIVINEQENGE